METGGVCVKEWSQSICRGKHAIGQLEESKGLAQGIHQRNEQAENLWDLTRKDVQWQNTQGLLSPAGTPEIIRWHRKGSYFSFCSKKYTHAL